MDHKRIKIFVDWILMNFRVICIEMSNETQTMLQRFVFNGLLVNWEQFLFINNDNKSCEWLICFIFRRDAGHKSK